GTRRARAYRGAPRTPSRRHTRVQRDDAAGEQPVPHLGEPRPLELPSQLLRLGEPAHARRQVAVRLAAAHESAEQRHEPVEPEPVEGREESARLRDLEDSDAAPRPEYPPQLAQ